MQVSGPETKRIKEFEMKNLFMIATAAAAMLSLSACSGYSEGSRTGTVSKLSYKGIVCKTWEGELVMGGLRSTTDAEGRSGVAANIFLFSVDEDNTEVIDSLKRVSETGERATLVYDQALIYNPCAQDTGYLITEVRTPQLR